MDVQRNVVCRVRQVRKWWYGGPNPSVPHTISKPGCWSPSLVRHLGPARIRRGIAWYISTPALPVADSSPTRASILCTEAMLPVSKSTTSIRLRGWFEKVCIRLTRCVSTRRSGKFIPYAVRYRSHIRATFQITLGVDKSSTHAHTKASGSIPQTPIPALRH